MIQHTCFHFFCFFFAFIWGFCLYLTHKLTEQVDCRVLSVSSITSYFYISYKLRKKMGRRGPSNFNLKYFHHLPLRVQTNVSKSHENVFPSKHDGKDGRMTRMKIVPFHWHLTTRPFTIWCRLKFLSSFTREMGVFENLISIDISKGVLLLNPERQGRGSKNLNFQFLCFFDCTCSI